MNLIPKKSLTRTTLIQMSLRIALIIIAVTLVSYWHLMQVLQSQTIEQLQKYIVERSQRESHLFKLAQTYHEVFKQEFIARYQAMGEEDPVDAFNHIFHKLADGTTRLRPEVFHGFKQSRGAIYKGATGFIDPKVILTPELRKRLMITYDLLTSYGTAWYKPFQNFYATTPQNMIITQQPDMDWALGMPADFDMTKEEWNYVADMTHNPSRQTTWTGLFYDEVAKLWMVSCITPVDINGQHLLSIGNDILLNDLFNRTIKDHLEGTYNLIFQANGRLIVDPERLAQIQAKAGQFYIPQSNDQHLINIFDKATHLASGQVVTDNPENDELLAVTQIQGPDWYLVTVYPKSLLTGMAVQNARFIFLLGILSLLTEVAALFFVLRRQVAQPLHEFMAATAQIAKGNFNLQLHTVREDELGQLAQHFETMASEIENRETGLKQANTVMEVMNQKLQQQIEERKQVEVELQKAKTLAEAANHAKSVFLANMSHELRTPLNGILGYAQILKLDDRLNEEQQEGIDVIQRSGEYLLALIADILDIAKIETEQFKLSPVEFDFSRFLKELVEIFQLRATQKKISFTCQPLSHLPTMVYADEKRVRQVLTHLLSNAIKFTKQGGVILKVTYEAGKICFQVEDTGIGMTTEDLAKIFLPFQQAGDPRWRPEGVGLGLSIVKKLVTMMGGEVRVESVLGQGSMFTAVLDLTEIPNFVLTEPKNLPIILGFEGERRTILVADDYQENRAVLVKLLTPLGFEVLEAYDGQDCLNQALAKRPDAIITDLVMPGIDGFELTRRLRSLPEFQDLVIIAASASVLHLDDQDSLAVGCNAFIPKPFSLNQLLELLQEYLDLTWIYKQSASSQSPTKSSNAVAQEAHKEPLPEFSVILSPEQAAVLYDFSMLGDLSSMVETMEQWAQENEQLAPIAHKICQLAKRYDLDQLEHLIQQYMKKLP